MGTIIASREVTRKQQQEILDYLTIEEEKKGRFKGQRTVLAFKERDGKLYLPLMFAQSYLKCLPVDNYPMCSFTMTTQPRAYQVAVIDEAKEYLRKCRSVSVIVPPSFGKTYIASYLASSLRGLTMVIIHRLPLYQQWSATFQKFTTALVWTVGEGSVPSKADVIICSIERVDKVPLELLAQVRVLIMDEFHCYYTQNRVDTLLSIQPYYNIALTATPAKHGLEGILYAFCGSHCVRRYNERPFRIVKLVTGIHVNKAADDWDGLCTVCAEDSTRNALVIQIIKALKREKIILLTPRFEHSKALMSMLKDQGESVDYLAGSKSTYHDSRILTGTISKIGTGFDEATSCLDFQGVPSDTLMMLGTTISPEALEQYVGRIFRAPEGVEPTVIQFIDSHPISNKHWRENAKWYRENMGRIEIYTAEQFLAVVSGKEV